MYGGVYSSNSATVLVDMAVYIESGSVWNVNHIVDTANICTSPTYHSD